MGDSASTGYSRSRGSGDRETAVDPLTLCPPLREGAPAFDHYTGTWETGLVDPEADVPVDVTCSPRTCESLGGRRAIVPPILIGRRSAPTLCRDSGTGYFFDKPQKVEPRGTVGLSCMLHGHYLQCFYTHKGQRGNGGGTLKCMGRLLELYDCLPPSFSPQRKSRGMLTAWCRVDLVLGGADDPTDGEEAETTLCGLACCSSPTCPGTAAVICQKSNTDLYILETVGDGGHRQLLIQYETRNTKH
uniref:Uncharacterized protein n=1 Tax=Musa acuminata TaxID=4641 RepID=Q1EPJ2_MUSAC|nr:hypothetical protein MA4_25J11.48 [Musa acuminata]